MSKDYQLKASINQKLIEMGERERLKELLRAKLVESGWKDQLKAHCKGGCMICVPGKETRTLNEALCSFFFSSDVVREKGLEHVTVEDLVTEVTPKGRGTARQQQGVGKGQKSSCTHAPKQCLTNKPPDHIAKYYILKT
uniref:ENY2 transcription and export complex 2 subunit n=1 Tax=Oryzias latipes TaxID=8090 RepID=A0A3P9KUJ6_ORYLA